MIKKNDKAKKYYNSYLWKVVQYILIVNECNTSVEKHKVAHLKKFFLPIRISMSLVLASGAVNNPAIDELVQSSLESETAGLRLEWTPCDKITDIKPTHIDSYSQANWYSS